MKEYPRPATLFDEQNSSESGVVSLLIRFFSFLIFIPLVGRILLSVYWYDRLGDDYGLLFQAFLKGIAQKVVFRRQPRKGLILFRNKPCNEFYRRAG